MGTPVGGGETSLSVGWGGDIPVFPPIALLLAFFVGLMLKYLLGRNRFLPSPFKHLFVRVSQHIEINRFLNAKCYFKL